MELQDHYDLWKSDPSPENLAGVVGKLRPTIDHAVAAAGAYDDPLIKNQAKLFAADAIKKFDPVAGGSALPTWVSGQLMQLRRFKRQNNAPIQIPERIQIDSWHLAKSERELQDKLGRDPDLVELSDHTKIPIKKIEKIRRTYRKMPGSAALPEDSGVGAIEQDFAKEAIDYVYQDADYIDRKVMELKMGYGGATDPLQPKDVAAKLKLTPSQLTRRSAKIAYRIQQVNNNLESIH